MRDIAFIGKGRAGKDTAFQILQEANKPVYRIAFGDVMKNHFHEIFTDIPREPKPTEAYQKFDVMREIFPLVWVNPTMERVRGLKTVSPTTSMIYTDVRNQDEYDAVKATGALMVRIHTDPRNRIARMEQLGEEFKPSMLSAPTETRMDNFEYDYSIFNDGTIEDFAEQVLVLYNLIEKGEL